MARITVEDCLKQVDNRFALIHLAAKRVRNLRKGAEPLVLSKNKDVVVALREIAAGKVFQAKEAPPAALDPAAEAAEPQALAEPAAEDVQAAEAAGQESVPEE